jgi:thioredoxin 1
MDTDKTNYKLLKFSASWCYPCKAMDPIVKSVVAGFDNIELINIDVDMETDLATSYNIRAIPAFVLLKDGEIVDRLIGAVTADKFKDFLSK